MCSQFSGGTLPVRWLEQASADVPAGTTWLSDGEEARWEQLRFAKRRADWRLGRWTAKCAVAACCGLRGEARTLRDIEIRAAACGAPEVYFLGEPAPLSLSLTHCDGHAVCFVAAAGVALGCDLERIEPRAPAFAADYFDGSELRLVNHVAAPARPRTITMIWSAKESALKALREGLRLDTRSVLVTIPDDAPLESADAAWQPLQVLHGEHGVFPGWWRTLGGCVLTIVASIQPRLPLRIDLDRADTRPSAFKRVEETTPPPAGSCGPPAAVCRRAW